jgi:hypothetical protein
LLYLRGGDGYPLVEWFEKTLGIDGEVLDGGNSVSNLLIDVAAAFGGSPIIMVGYDLAYTKGARYAKSLSESLEKGEKIKFKGETRGEMVAGSDYEGKEVLTEVKWVVEANWIEKFHEEKPEIPLFNTTKEGLCLKSIPYKPLEEVLKSFCSSSLDIDGKVHLAIQEASLTNVSNREIGDAFVTMSQSLARCKDVLHKLQELAEDDLFDEESVVASQLVNELESECAFEWIFQPFSMMHKKLWFLRKVVECRTISEAAFNAKAAQERYQLLIEACAAHQQFFFSDVGWAYLNGHFLPGGSSIPWPEDMQRCPSCLRDEVQYD